MYQLFNIKISTIIGSNFTHVHLQSMFLITDHYSRTKSVESVEKSKLEYWWNYIECFESGKGNHIKALGWNTTVRRQHLSRKDTMANHSKCDEPKRMEWELCYAHIFIHRVANYPTGFSLSLCGFRISCMCDFHEKINKFSAGKIPCCCSGFRRGNHRINFSCAS